MNTATMVLGAVCSILTILISLWRIISSLQNVMDRLDSLEKKVDIHNSYGDKIGSTRDDIHKLTTTVSVIQKDIEWLKNKSA